MFSTAINSFLKQNNYPDFSPKAVFFDMDGVLFDSMKYHASAWVQALTDVNIPFTHYEAYLNEGRTGHSTIDDAFNRTHGRDATEIEKQQIYQLKSKYFEKFDSPERIPFVTELLNKIKLQGMQIFVVTGSGQASLIDNLQLHFPDIFQKSKMVTAYDVIQGKPFPEPYLKALKKSGVKPWEVIVIENAPLGVESAKAAGLFTLAVNTGPLDKKVLFESGADIVFDNMEELNEKWNVFLSEIVS
ncbi:MAG TPA: HAD-IA family hydrolase [Paludibacter sp.]|nr:HAD-IA family hydrolase [Paludibacter sp.]